MQPNRVNYYLYMIKFTHERAIFVLVNKQLVKALAIMQASFQDCWLLQANLGEKQTSARLFYNSFYYNCMTSSTVFS